ncbi:malto-oligosyltrehalose synthase [Quadrisphaera sp. DSM 44207]|uniref:malto-oligosyltrehalose synthase n=1 Tax=Quadrisphaera sp. DSM 44207 TaxID=1881057 RepID=UPI00087EED5A|nr:malto-oligosyltrehalose synthase [Quadrisphaera sp. DSM 44207]SDQ48863.1 maltooligosyl trehalose synthase [Quadrisphaera sp. DSM 44207]
MNAHGHAHGHAHDPRHRPAPGRPQPVSTYRLQIRSEFGFGAAADVVDHLHGLGVTHAYLSPVLAPAPGSAHGYDVVDHSRLNPEAGGREAFDALVARLHERRMGAVADVVPNHMAVPTPATLNAALWSVLRDGPDSPFGRWFDVDWSGEDHALLMPVLGARIGQVLASGELRLDGSGPEPLLRYYDHVFPVRPGTESLPLAELVDRQFYRLAHWRVADEELNYRRFFDVDTLAAIRVEDPEVFDATHALLLELVAVGQLDGLRIDHPDGLADPRGYLRRLHERTGGVWVVVEKILEGDEDLPPDWPCAGTTGYDALLRVGGLFVDPAGAAPLSAFWAETTGDPRGFAAVVEQAKREVVEHGLYAEVHRLTELLRQITHADVRLRDHTERGLRECVVELLVAFDRYRAYVVPGEAAPAVSVEAVDHAVAVARSHLPAERWDTLDAVRDLLLGLEAGSAGRTTDAQRAELVVRFQQTCGPVMAKGVEDTAFYRWFRLSSLDEVGGDPDHFGVAPEEFHAYSSSRAHSWPVAMTTLSTHDTKRSEDVRARLAVLSELPGEWAQAVRSWREAAAEHRAAELDGATEQLVWQTLVGTWGSAEDGKGPISAERLVGYLEKAVREAKVHTTWTSQDRVYEDAVRSFATGVLSDARVLDAVGAFCERIAEPVRAGVLGQKLVQLCMPGVPDVYQGSELVDLSLVDPDNRRPVDYADRRARLARLDSGARPSDLSDEKLLVTSRALRLRRDAPEWFVGEDAAYAAVPTSTGNAVAFARGDAGGPGAVVVATRLAVSLERLGGWGGHTVAVPEGSWRDLLTGAEVRGGGVRLADLLHALPVALLVRA